jgi:cysteinyl-tRNA synthetase, unknown class
MTVTAVVAGVLLLLAAAAVLPGRSPREASRGDLVPGPDSHWVYQLQAYTDGRLDEVAAAGADVAVVDLARDAKQDWFRPDEIDDVKARGAVVLAYLEIGSIENFRPEASTVRKEAPDLVLNRWEDWPEEHFVRYWDERWWDMVVRPRIDQALQAGFDGVYMDTPLAYEELDLKLVPGATRGRLAGQMANLIVRISDYAKEKDPGFLIVPQNSPELRLQPGYVEAIDGIGMEELFVLATDELCTQDWCEENLGHTRVLRDLGKFVLAVDYADDPDMVALAQRRHREEGFFGYVGPVELNEVRPQPRPSDR